MLNRYRVCATPRNPSGRVLAVVKVKRASNLKAGEGASQSRCQNSPLFVFSRCLRPFFRPLSKSVTGLGPSVSVQGEILKKKTVNLEMDRSGFVGRESRGSGLNTKKW